MIRIVFPLKDLIRIRRSFTPISNNMKAGNLIALALFLSIAHLCFAQKKNPAPTQQDMQKMMQQAQQMMKEMESEMSPEDKKLMDSLGFKMPDMNKASKSIPAVSNKQLADAWENENRIVPKKDAARIAAIPKIAPGNMKSYLVSIHQKSSAALSPEIVSLSNKILENALKSGLTLAQSGTMAAGFWTIGKPEIALYLLGKACIESPTNTDNLCNYAAVLSMSGGQHLAIPILNNLNAQFRKNSTVLNNLGQAWFGLGEMTKAQSYLDSAIAIYPYHPQANLTKSRIEESKGNTTKAIECVKKSLKHAYSKEKEDRLRQLGYKIKLADLSFSFKPDVDPLGSGRYKRPDYPKSVAEMKAMRPYWITFNDEVEAQIAKLQKEYTEQSKKYADNMGNMTAEAMQAINKGGTMPAFMRPPLFSTKAGLAMKQLEQHQTVVEKRITEKYITLRGDLDKIDKERPHADPSAPCSAHRDAYNAYISKYNERKKVFDDEILELRRFFYDEMAFWAQFTSTDKTMYENIRLSFQISWLQLLNDRLYQPVVNYPQDFEECIDENNYNKAGKLSEFDNTDACKYKSVVKFGPLKLTTNCSHSTYELSFDNIPMGPLKEFEAKYTEVGTKYENSSIKVVPKTLGIDAQLGPVNAELGIGSKWEVKMDANGVTDWKGTISPGAEIGVGISSETIKAGASVGASVDIEVGAGGVSDINIVNNVKAGIGLNADGVPPALEMGVESRVSIITGQSSTSGTGILSGVKF